MSRPVASMTHGVVALGGRPVLHGVSLQAATGEVVALLGANGSGKSTLVRTLVGLVPLAAGRVELFGRPLSSFRDWARVGYVPQRLTAAAGVPATVREVVTSGRLSRSPWWRPLGRADRAAVDTALDVVGLSGRAADSVARLSGGQQQRVLVARALASEPDLLVLDEPMAGVDLPSQDAFAATLTRLVRTGTTILLVAHELGALHPLVDRAVVLRAGRVVYDGAPAEPTPHLPGQPVHVDGATGPVHPHAPAHALQAGWFS